MCRCLHFGRLTRNLLWLHAQEQCSWLKAALRCYHVYKDVMTIGADIECARESDNPTHCYAVAMKKLKAMKELGTFHGQCQRWCMLSVCAFVNMFTCGSSRLHRCAALCWSKVCYSNVYTVDGGWTIRGLSLPENSKVHYCMLQLASVTCICHRLYVLYIYKYIYPSLSEQHLYI